MPHLGPGFLEQVIRDNIDIGARQGLPGFAKKVRRERKRAPARFPTRVIINGVTPGLHAHYRHAAIKQCSKDRQALQQKPPSTMRTASGSWHAQVPVTDKYPARTLPPPRHPSYTAKRASRPPSTVSVDPVMNLAWSLSRNITADAISDGCPRNPTGWFSPQPRMVASTSSEPNTSAP